MTDEMMTLRAIVEKTPDADGGLWGHSVHSLSFAGVGGRFATQRPGEFEGLIFGVEQGRGVAAGTLCEQIPGLFRDKFHRK